MACLGKGVLFDLQHLDLDKLLLRRRHPIFLHAEPRIEHLLLHRIPVRRGLGKNFDDKVRRALDVTLSDDIQPFLRDEQNIRLHNVFFVKVDIVRSAKDLAEPPLLSE